MFFGMLQTEPIQCPFCGQTFELEIDMSVPDQSFVIGERGRELVEKLVDHEWWLAHLDH
jgi:hypothetical protein